MALADRSVLKAPVTLAEQAEALRPGVLVLDDADFLPQQSILRFRGGKPQRVFDALRALMRAERFDKGCVAIIGHTEAPRMKRYADDLGRRRAEAVKAAIAGDAERARLIMERIYKAETFERVRSRWLRDEADELLEIVSPDVPAGGDGRVRRFQAEAGLRPDGLPAGETWEALIEAYANEVSLARWIIPQKVYTAISTPSHEHGKVELWVWPSSPPPEGSMVAWRARGPAYLETKPPEPAPASGASAPAPGEAPAP